MAHDLQTMALDMLLDRLVELDLVKYGGRQRTDATHVVAAVRELNRWEMVGETLRAALDALAAAAPDWLTRHTTPAMINRYLVRIDEWRLPNDLAKRHKLGVQTGQDGFKILQAVADRRAPIWLREIPAVDVLRRVWIQQYTIGENRWEVIWRDAQQHGFPPGRTRIISPCDTDARHSAKREMRWTGHKVHISDTSETCDNTPDAEGKTDPSQPPNLITNVVSTHAAVADQTMTTPIADQLADRDLLPGEQLMDAGYATTASLLACRADQVRLIAPHRRDFSRHTRTDFCTDPRQYRIRHRRLKSFKVRLLERCNV